MLRKMQTSVESGRLSRDAMAYFASILDAQPELTSARNEAFQKIGSQDTQRMTRHQQQMLSEHLLKKGCAAAAARLQRAHAEEHEQQSYIKEGKPTSESYWFEDTGLISADVPNFLKDEILDDMQKQRRRDSPAFLRPEDVATVEGSDTAGPSIFEEGILGTGSRAGSPTDSAHDAPCDHERGVHAASSSTPMPAPVAGKRVRFQQSTDGFFD